MAAPNTAYLNNGNAIRMDEEDLAAAIINSYDALIAAYIYGASDIKALFYLDAIVEVQMTDDAGTVLGTGFIGLVIPGGFNYKHHASSRRFKGSLAVYDDAGALITDYVALNDGGLNTLGHDPTPIVLLAGAQAGNLIISNQLYKSAYYIATSSYGFNYRVNSDYWRNVVVGNTINQNTQIQADVTSYTASAYQKGDSVELTVWIANAEGTYESDIHTFVALARTISLKEGAYASYACASSTNTLFYLKTGVFGVGKTIYTDSGCLDPALIDYYSDGANWYRHVTANGQPASRTNIPTITVMGACGTWPTTDPAYQAAYSSKSYKGYSDTLSAEACTIGNNTANPTLYLYYSTSEAAPVTYYQESARTNLAAAGYYSIGGSWFRINSLGKIISTGTC